MNRRSGNERFGVTVGKPKSATWIVLHPKRVDLLEDILLRSSDAERIPTSRVAGSFLRFRDAQKLAIRLLRESVLSELGYFLDAKN